MASLDGTRLGHYEILRSIGAGGMGDVYRARDPRLDREVAIKVLSAQLAADPDALARFEREAMSVAKLSHPNILSIFEFGRDGSTAFVVTELVDGETLRARIESGPERQRPLLQTLTKRRTKKEFRNGVGDPLVDPEIMNREDVRM